MKHKATCPDCKKTRFLVQPLRNNGICKRCSAIRRCLAFHAEHRKSYPQLDFVDWFPLGSSSPECLVTCPHCKKQRHVRRGTVLFRIRNSKWRGFCSRCSRLGDRSYNFKGRYLNDKGYYTRNRHTFSQENLKILDSMFAAKVRIQEHRAVMALSLGRPLTKNEIVHHINGIKSDNSLSNLLLVTPSGHAKVISDFQKRIEFLEDRLKLNNLPVF